MYNFILSTLQGGVQLLAAVIAFPMAAVVSLIIGGSRLLVEGVELLKV